MNKREEAFFNSLTEEERNALGAKATAVRLEGSLIAALLPPGERDLFLMDESLACGYHLGYQTGTVEPQANTFEAAEFGLAYAKGNVELRNKGSETPDIHMAHEAWREILAERAER